METPSAAAVRAGIVAARPAAGLRAGLALSTGRSAAIAAAAGPGEGAAAGSSGTGSTYSILPRSPASGSAGWTPAEAAQAKAISGPSLSIQRAAIPLPRRTREPARTTGSREEKIRVP